MNDFMEEEIHMNRSPEAGIMACKVGPLGEALGPGRAERAVGKACPRVCIGASVGDPRQDSVSSLGLEVWGVTASPPRFVL